MVYYYLQERDANQDSGFLYKIYSENEDDRTLLETTGWRDDAEGIVDRYRTEDVMRNRELTGIDVPGEIIGVYQHPDNADFVHTYATTGGWTNLDSTVSVAAESEDLSKKVDALSEKMDKIILMLDTKLTSDQLDLIDEVTE